MWSNTIPASGRMLCLIFALSPLCVNAEITTHTTALNTSSVINQSNPLMVYQQALDYLLGRNGAVKSAEKAAGLFKTLAEQNWSSAQHMLGNMYLRGKGVEKNDLLAYKWLSLASKNNLQLAKAIHNKRRQLYENLQNNLSLQSLNKVETWITEWEPTKTRTQLN
ncbi:MAG: hypothetical protein DIZ80_16290 [endosymbiont of Galathealinum brachiosum]|uniref:Sel1 repeat family protein n=1 Tax=endosymbiont of Galathealinum brachiosum TaxID=2200906 RepID=A0A370D9Q8_9GAMM|nr:MAG: hypothetical protein DIZ80_16290 [endosymbiont of Galathealinum brachiosum]